MNVTIISPGTLPPLDILFDAPLGDTITVTRLIGRIAVLPQNPTDNVASIQRVDMGIGVTSEEAFGVAAISSIADNTQYPIRGWLWADTYAMMVGFRNSTSDMHVLPEVRFDIRAQRKVDKGNLYFTAANNLAAGTALTIRLVGRIRALCLT